jgi:predicted Zn-ribbon and HTH transcriptional regulator
MVSSAGYMPTTRQQMILLLSEGNCTARDLSQTLGVREKEVYAHLAHIARSVVPQRQSHPLKVPFLRVCL